MSAVRKNSLDNSGASSESFHFRFPEFFFFCMGMPHRHDVPRIFARRPDHHHQAIVEEIRGHKAGFTTGAFVRCAGSVHAGKDLGSAGEIQIALLQRLRALCFRPAQPHIIYVPPIIKEYVCGDRYRYAVSRRRHFPNVATAYCAAWISPITSA
jgi:hypothetical protein